MFRSSASRSLASLRAAAARCPRSAATPSARRAASSSSSGSASGSSSAVWIGAAALGAAGLGYWVLSKDSAPKPAAPEPVKAAIKGLPANSPFKAKPTVIFVLGGPGAGKGTQCARLVRDYDFVHLSAGDLLRAERQRPGSAVGELINTYIKEGQIVPMEITIKLLETAMLESGKSRFLIDGFPRKMDQADAFEETVAAADFVLYFSCPEEEMLRRLLKRGESSGRVDDNLESIKKRFATFRDTSYPVIEKYRADGKVHEVSCLQSIDGVYAQVRKVFDDMFANEDKAVKA
ncbi:UMP-CMP kinase [Allomyces macrogynus ATCC 38327]|uniref:Uridylate kinase n=1 Tax=Allomyces macrogynus (strain ATCC 38327) TaxID=578462 RepID=A0A0L0SB77_ALLM3|nr:UMP-CMP kinase [Allomyces macrogynus ATCC 38327]|eukprot:KNE59645.1 UMP-CMP kinase [Allomyces macrogynus ATCC 38327]